MERESKDKFNQYLINTDILALFRYGADLQWNEIRQNSVYRILYLTSVLYSFRYPEKDNPFSIYKFSVDQTGPYNSNISNAIAFLTKDDYLKRTSGDDMLSLGSSSSEEILKSDINSDRVEWIKNVMYILGIYGENKIYEFIFRDPEYQTTIMANSQQGLDIGKENETIKTLRSFQTAFEETLAGQQNRISTQSYLELYFEYIFSKILKREE
jgi:hypothetical protein